MKMKKENEEEAGKTKVNETKRMQEDSLEIQSQRKRWNILLLESLRVNQYNFMSIKNTTCSEISLAVEASF